MSRPHVPKHRPTKALASRLVDRPRRPHGTSVLTSPDRIYPPDEQEFILAVRRWQETTGVKFPTFADYLSILKDLGYRKAAQA